ncbi:YbbR-like domain-containing protein [Mucilaginibacter robiniae]|uniref:YbbR-like domain-containing protein n=1 Tax=Mucilaginibacter robiniae TaxID=2728022 RepID=A0A7L5DWJ2_9SPHI|nr:YbbR-like domain-containing protein [Mucilaginibacter robiniae]QJD94437.1 YbbR-like domain-containing protein [Mucilaginibacter robiniae]
MALVKLSASERRRLTAFITCLLVAMVAWVFATLSSTYNFTSKKVISFKNTPLKRAFRSLQSDTAIVTVQGNGWQMLLSKISPDIQPVYVDLHTLEHSNYIALNTQLAQINTQHNQNEKVIAIDPDTLYFDFTNRLSKKVPVQPVLNIKYQSQYKNSSRIVVKPAYIILNGPTNLIDKITSWKTDTLKLQNISNTIDANINLQATKEANINFYPKTVQVHIPVEEFTEKVLSVPVKIINNQHYDNIKVFPQRVKVTFTTPLSRYAEIDEDFFEATADLNFYLQYGYSVLPVKITHAPAYCNIVSIEPQNIDFLIKK